MSSKLQMARRGKALTFEEEEIEELAELQYGDSRTFAPALAAVSIRRLSQPLPRRPRLSAGAIHKITAAQSGLVRR